MKARVKILKYENVSGTSSKTGNDYDLDFIHFLDLDNFDKVKLLVGSDDCKALSAQIGKEGVLDCSVNPKTERLEFSGFKAAA